MIDTYVRHSPSACNLFTAEPAMFVLERVLGKKQAVGIPAHRGVAVEDGVTAGLTKLDMPVKKCVEIAVAKYDSLTVLSSDPRRDKYRSTIKDMVETALAELRQYGTPSGMQGFVTWQPDGLKLPIVGYYDYEYAQHGMIIDLKTTERMPSEIKNGHARQVAHYAASDNIDARLAYVTPRKMEVYKLENIRQHREALLKIAVTIEKFLALSNDPQFFVSITVPNLDGFYWNEPSMRQMAFEIWKV